MNDNDIWLQSLGLLFEACEPLNNYCLLSKKRRNRDNG